MSKKILGVGLAIVGAALMFTGVGTPLGMLAASGALASVSVASVIGMGLMVGSNLLMGPAKPKGLHTQPGDHLMATMDLNTPRKFAFGLGAMPTDVRFTAR